MSKIILGGYTEEASADPEISQKIMLVAEDIKRKLKIEKPVTISAISFREQTVEGKYQSTVVKVFIGDMLKPYGYYLIELSSVVGKSDTGMVTLSGLETTEAIKTNIARV